MKHKTAELIGAELDAAVAKAQGFAILSHNGETWAEDGEHGFLVGYIGGPAQHVPSYSPSTDWQDGGPIIARERIEFYAFMDGSFIAKLHGKLKAAGDGPTHLIAAMRAYVLSKLGDEVDL